MQTIIINVIRHGDVNSLCKQVIDMSVISFQLATDYGAGACDEYVWDITREYQMIFVSKSVRRNKFCFFDTAQQ